MSDPTRDGGGVIFRREDCASVLRRLIAAFTDGFVLLVFAIAWDFVCYFVTMDRMLGLYLWLGSTPLFLTAYLGALKRSSLGTPGYRLAGIRVVSLDGGVPGLWPLFIRSTAAILWSLTGSILFFVDMLWIFQDEQRQTMRDKIAGTLVVRRGAEPAGVGKQRVRLYSFLGWTLYLREVVRTDTVADTPDTPVAAAAAAGQPV